MKMILFVILIIFSFSSNAKSCIKIGFGFCVKYDRNVTITHSPPTTMLRIDIKGVNFPVFALPLDYNYLEIRKSSLSKNKAQFICETIPSINELIYTSGDDYKCD